MHRSIRRAVLFRKSERILDCQMRLRDWGSDCGGCIPGRQIVPSSRTGEVLGGAREVAKMLLNAKQIERVDNIEGPELADILLEMSDLAQPFFALV